MSELEVLAFVVPLRGRGEALFAGIDLPARGLRCTRQQASRHAQHVVLQKG